MLYAGCDPGKSGCLCLLDTTNSLITFFDWPKDDNLRSYFSTLSEVFYTKVIKLLVLEKVHSMPSQGVKSMFSFGQNYGCWLGLFAVCKVPHLIVSPQVWMKGLVTKSDGPDTKSAVKNVATRLFPKAELYGTKGGYRDGRGDALLMAEYARQQVIGNK